MLAQVLGSREESKKLIKDDLLEDVCNEVVKETRKPDRGIEIKSSEHLDESDRAGCRGGRECSESSKIKLAGTGEAVEDARVDFVRQEDLENPTSPPVMFWKLTYNHGLWHVYKTAFIGISILFAESCHRFLVFEPP